MKKKKGENARFVARRSWLALLAMQQPPCQRTQARREEFQEYDEGDVSAVSHSAAHEAIR